MNTLLVAFDIAVIILALFFLFYHLIFLRDPKKFIAQGQNIVSPCDGTIKKILRLDSKSERGLSEKELIVNKGIWGRIKSFYIDTVKEGYMIIITMNIFNVHYQYSPIDGNVRRVKYSPGKFLNAVFNAREFKAMENEKNEIIIENEKMKVKVIQIAGLIARRIVCFAKEKQKVKKGQKIGLIKLGSQIVLIMPLLNLQVREGQRVSGAETVIALY